VSPGRAGAPGSRDAAELARARDELRRLGYLTHRLDRFLLQDGLRPQGPWLAVWRVAGKVGLLAGVVVAVANALALAAANGNLAASPLDLLPLLAHLLVPAALGAILLVLALAAGVVLFLRYSPARRIEAVAFGVAATATTALAALALWLGRGLWRLLPPWQLGAAAVAAPAVAWALTKLFEGALLALAIRLTQATPASGRFGRRTLAAGLAGLALLLLLPVALMARKPRPAAPNALPQSPGDRVLLVALDGVLPSELDYLLARGELRTLGRLAREGIVASYARPAASPPTFWTTVATGVAADQHGVTALDSFRPLGLETPLARSGPWRLWWSGVEEPLGLAEYRPLLAGRRRALAFWELAARGGAPIAAIDWWATFPAEELPGLVVAHGAFQLLGEGVEGAVAPPAMTAAMATLARQANADGADDLLRAALGRDAAEVVLERAVRPDRFYRAALASQLGGAPRAAALYLPGLDIAAEAWRGGELAFDDLVRSELAATDALVAAATTHFETIAVVADPGRRGAESGRVILWRASGCAPPATAAGPSKTTGTVAAPIAKRSLVELVPGQVAAALLRALGLAQSRELPEPPAACAWEPPTAVLATYGERRPAASSAAESAEYLQNLRSLGYL
jgi:hypothetical protein